MRTIRRLIEAKKAQREENGEAGFSLIELIIVVVILGILVAIAIPVFNGVQATARKGAAQTAASDGATAVAAAIAQGGGQAAIDAAITNALDKNSKGNITVTNEKSASDVEGVCVKALDSTDPAAVWFAGPAALKNGSACS
jgi:prepilin-type N-terminal cleavage/methylation domain-containing protein